jgi:hypothetical protein
MGWKRKTRVEEECSVWVRATGKNRIVIYQNETIGRKVQRGRNKEQIHKC